MTDTTGTEPFRFTDADGDYLHIGIPTSPTTGHPAISFCTLAEPVHVPMEQIEGLITALRRLVAAQSAVSPAAVEPPADQTTPSHRAALRDRITTAISKWHRDPEQPLYEQGADAVLVVLYREWPWLRAEAEDAEPTAGAADRDRIAAAALAAVETALRDTLTPDARKEALAGIMAVLPEPADRATVLRDAAEALHARAKHYTGEFNDSDILHEDGPAATVATWKRAGAYVRRMADETATETPEPHRGDAFEQWLKARRDEWAPEGCQPWQILDQTLEEYRLHADTGTPLGEHVCEARVVGDCECLEQPAAGARQDGSQP